MPLGLLTNGDAWRLVYAAPGLTTSYITWSAAGWMDERATLSAFAMLLRDPAALREMASESQQRQADVTDQLGAQVLNAVSLLVRQLDRADADSRGALLAGLSADEVYEMALVVMMRLVFIFYAEENALLPHGDVLYDKGYGVTVLWNRLDRARRMEAEYFDQRFDAWPQLLATFRLIHAGCEHPDLIMPAYGGDLFDPERFPALEDQRLRISNAAMWRMLRHLTTAQATEGRQRVSYRALAVEQLGYVYEGLLGYTIKHAKETMIVPSESTDAHPLADFEAALQSDLYEYLKSITGLHWSQARALAEEIEERAKGQGDRLWVWEPATDALIEPGARYVAPQMGTRKRGGIFYTPPQLTSFLVEQALEPQCYADEAIKPARDILALTVCDPAMGSGAFLVQAVRYLSERLLEAWDAATADANDTRLVMPFAEPAGSAIEDYGPIPADRDEARAWARRLVAERCIYGVDLNALAVELAKLSLWLVTLSKDKPFTFLDHRLRHGNSLIGASFMQETEVEHKKGRTVTRGKARQIAFIPDEALQAPKGADKATLARHRDLINSNRQATQAIAAGQMSLFADRTIEEALAELAGREAAFTAPTERAGDYARKRALLDAVLAQGHYPTLKEVADLWCAVWFWPREVAEHGPPPTTQEYHDAVYSILEQPAIVLTAPERIAQIRRTAREVAAREHFYHWELAYPEIFTRDNSGFDAMVGNPPWEVVKPNSQEFFEAYDPNFRNYGKQEAIRVSEQLMQGEPAVAEAWRNYEISQEQQAAFASSGVVYQRQGRGDINTYKLFAERFYSLIEKNGYLGVMMPSGIYTDLGSKELREMLFDEGQIQYLFSFSNERFF